MLREQEDWALQESGLSLNSVREMSVGCNGFIKEFASSLLAGMAAKLYFFQQIPESCFSLGGELNTLSKSEETTRWWELVC